MKKEVGEIPQGSYFRKLTGSYVYLRISASSVKFLGLDEDWVYGVCYNGNTVKLKLDHPVIIESIDSFLGNIKDDQEWSKTVGCHSE